MVLLIPSFNNIWTIQQRIVHSTQYFMGNSDWIPNNQSTKLTFGTPILKE